MTSVYRHLNLTHLASQLPTVFEAARLQQLSYEAFLTQAVEVKLTGREARAQTRRLRAARLPFAARVEHFDFRFQPSLSERTIRELASLSFMTTATNIFFLGPPGVGKTHLACGLAQAAMDAGHTALFVTLRELAQQFDAPAPRGGQAAVRRYSQPALLISDEVGYT